MRIMITYQLGAVYARLCGVMADHGMAWLVTLVLAYLAGSGGVMPRLVACTPVAWHTVEHMITHD